MHFRKPHHRDMSFLKYIYKKKYRSFQKQEKERRAMSKNSRQIYNSVSRMCLGQPVFFEEKQKRTNSTEFLCALRHVLSKNSEQIFNKHVRTETEDWDLSISVSCVTEGIKYFMYLLTRPSGSIKVVLGTDMRKHIYNFACDCSHVLQILDVYSALTEKLTTGRQDVVNKLKKISEQKFISLYDQRYDTFGLYVKNATMPQVKAAPVSFSMDSIHTEAVVSFIMNPKRCSLFSMLPIPYFSFGGAPVRVSDETTLTRDNFMTLFMYKNCNDFYQQFIDFLAIAEKIEKTMNLFIYEVQKLSLHVVTTKFVDGKIVAKQEQNIKDLKHGEKIALANMIMSN